MQCVTRIVSCALALTVLLAPWTLAGPGPKPKLDAPLNVTCAVVDTNVVVSWDLVVGAVAYQVESIGIVADGSTVEDSEFVAGPPVLIPVDDFASLAVHVRGLTAPKHAHNPVQAGRKGFWSDVCVVELPAP